MKPRQVDRFQTFIATRSLTTLVVLYVLGTAFVATGIAFIWVAATPGPILERLPRFCWFCFVFLYGYQPTDLGIPAGFRPATTVLSVASLLLPVMLLGTFVFKILLPRRNRVVFLDRMGIDEMAGQQYLAVYCTLVTRLEVVDWRFQVYLRFNAHDRQERFPLRTVRYELPSQSREIPLPFAMVPSRILIPYAEIDGAPDPESANIQLRRTEGRISLAFAHGQTFNGDLLTDMQILVLTTGKLPALGLDFVETKCYHVDDIDFEKHVRTETIFDLREGARGVVKDVDWEAFH